ncbi:uncharacterized protein LOC126657122 [Mercurialis annua]|uniref:uncharacterized protein LOC126657122 n=1 Tax=Mercurialis annua TaxID=3986 RepID=UPI00215E26D2|nr:uncharacterized protein LOC126657122 [Mercurialis annua]
MKIFSWNLQGLGNSWTVRALKLFIKNNSPDIFFLIETKLVRSEFVDSDGRKGGLALFWRKTIDVNIVTSSHNHVAFMVIFGDFNLHLFHGEKYGGRDSDQREMDMFREALDSCGVADLGHKGGIYTWSNRRRDDNLIQIRLDRFVANMKWQESHPGWLVSHLSRYKSDHCPILLDSTGLDRSSEFGNLLSFFNSFNSFIVDSDGRKGGLALFWRKTIDVNIVTSSHNHVAFMVTEASIDNSWMGIGMYGWSESQYKSRTCELIKDLRCVATQPQVIFGDFNLHLFHGEKYGGRDSDQREMDMFREALDSCGVADLGHKGGIYTWSNRRRDDNLIQIRLDRFVANMKWQESHPGWLVSHISRYKSDHCPILLDSTGLDRSSGGVPRSRPFRFEQMWMTNDNFDGVVSEAWRESGMGSMDFMTKIEACGANLKSWALSNFGAVNKSKKQKLEELLQLQNHTDPDRVYERCQQVSAELDDILTTEEIMWKQRSRADWLREGDRNTKFFHNKASNRKKNNFIHRIQDGSGTWKQGKEVFTVVEEYYRQLFTTSYPTNQDRVLACIDSALTAEQFSDLQRPFSEEEVIAALKQMGSLKAPGPDGMPVLFYNSYWHVVGKDVIACILDFLSTGTMPSRANHTFLTLIPKIATPETMKDLRPISLCNVIYKLIAKVIANRLKGVLSGLIDEAQSAFVPGRMITDNAMIAFEVFHSMAKRSQGKQGAVALKLDMSKAYDRVEWSFIERVLEKMGFPHHFIRLIMVCISSVSFSFLINGTPFGLLYPERGLRQGDPLSPYLFLICSEGFSALIRKGIRDRVISGGRVCRGGPRISHLLFADDSVLFIKASSREGRALKEIITSYEEASGQVVNIDKSEMFFSTGVAQNHRTELAEMLGFRVVDYFKKYLGMPTLVGRSKKPIFAFLKERLHKRVLGWKEKFLSKAGREVLIKSIAQSIPTYVMSCFALPVTFCNEMRSIISKFWWSGTDDKNKISWVSWQSICKPKSEGGLGFRNLHAFNLAMLAKQAWKLAQDPHSLCARVLKAKYFQHTDFLQAGARRGSSFLWQSIMEGKRVLDTGVAWRIGNGEKVDVGCKVKYFLTADGRWDVEKLQNCFSSDDVSNVLKIPLSRNLPPDKLFWTFNRNGFYTVKSGYYQACKVLHRDVASSSSSHNNDGLWKRIWRLSVQPKVRHFIWRILHESLPCNAKLARRIPASSELCPRCGVVEESQLHALKDCEMFNRLKKDEVHIFVMSLWVIWLDRNNIVFDNNRHPPDLLFRSVYPRSDQRSASDRRSNALRPPVLVEWEPPATGTVKINTDAAISAAKNRSVSSAICRDENGRVLRWGVKLMQGVVDAELAEAHAVLFGIQLASTFLGTQLVFESYASNVISRLLNPSSAIDPIQLVIEDCLDLVKGSNVVFKFARRQCNHVAHALAKWGVFYDKDYICNGSVPFPVNELINVSCD